jgi:CBS-domain-containing membrane protein
MKAAAIMTEDVVTINALATIAQAAQLMRQKSVRVLMVERATTEDAYGIVSETDIVQKVVALGNVDKCFINLLNRIICLPNRTQLIKLGVAVE